MSGVLGDGYQSLITFSSTDTVKFYEKTIKPIGFDGGGGVDTTTMRNSTVRTSEPKALITTMPVSVTAAYEVAVIDVIYALINVKQQIVITFPDGDTVTFWGWLSKFDPGDLKEGEQPTATIEIISGNTNASKEETEPAYAAAP